MLKRNPEKQFYPSNQSLFVWNQFSVTTSILVKYNLSRSRNTFHQVLIYLWETALAFLSIEHSHHGWKAVCIFNQQLLPDTTGYNGGIAHVRDNIYPESIDKTYNAIWRCLCRFSLCIVSISKRKRARIQFVIAKIKFYLYRRFVYAFIEG